MLVGRKREPVKIVKETFFGFWDNYKVSINDIVPTSVHQKAVQELTQWAAAATRGGLQIFE